MSTKLALQKIPDTRHRRRSLYIGVTAEVRNTSPEPIREKQLRITQSLSASAKL